MKRVTRLLPVLTFLSCLGLCAGSFAAAPYVDGHRIAVSHDGNSWDKDDWGAAPLMLAIIAQYGHIDDLVYFDYNCNVKNNEAGWDQNAMNERVMEQAGEYGFNTADFFEIRTERNAAKTALKNEILASSSTNRLWIIMAGPPDTIYDAMLEAKNTDYTTLKHCTIISHSAWNHYGNNGADCFHDIDDILALNAGTADDPGFTIITNQNTLLNTQQDKTPWNHFNTSGDQGENNVWDAEVNSNGTLIIGRMDYSDAGMGYYLFTGAQNCSPSMLQTLFAGPYGGGGTPPDFSDDFEDGNANGWTTFGGSWSVVTDGSKWYKQSSGSVTAASAAGDSGWTNYSVEAKMKPITFVAGSTAGICARFNDTNNKYTFLVNKDQGKIKIMRKAAGVNTMLAEKLYTINAGTTYAFKAVVDGSTLDFYVNGVQELTAIDSTFASGCIALDNYKTVVEYDDVLVTEIGGGGGDPETVTYKSVAAEDGYVTESTETSNAGGAADATASGSAGLRLGDTASDQQMKTVLSFDTSGLPDGATIVSATLRIHRGTISGTSPFTTHGTCYADVKTGPFNGSATLETADFQAAADATQVATMSTAPTNWTWSEGTVNATGLTKINKTGKTQFRVYFTLDDNDDTGMDYLGYCPGEYTDSGIRPELVVTYQP